MFNIVLFDTYIQYGSPAGKEASYSIPNCEDLYLTLCLKQYVGSESTLFAEIIIKTQLSLTSYKHHRP